MLDWLVPDIPKSVEDEIRREKLLASKLAQQAKEEDARTERTYTDASLTVEP